MVSKWFRKTNYILLFYMSNETYTVNLLNKKRVVGNEYQYFLFTMNVELDTIVKKPFLRYSRCHDALVIVKKK